MNTPAEPPRTGVEIAPEGMADPGPGRHLWMYHLAFRASDELIGRMSRGEEPGAVFFDHENVMDVQGPGCFKCERLFTPQLAAAPCRGSMDL